MTLVSIWEGLHILVKWRLIVSKLKMCVMLQVHQSYVQYFIGRKCFYIDIIFYWYRLTFYNLFIYIYIFVIELERSRMGGAVCRFLFNFIWQKLLLITFSLYSWYFNAVLVFFWSNVFNQKRISHFQTVILPCLNVDI